MQFLDNLKARRNKIYFVRTLKTLEGFEFFCRMYSGEKKVLEKKESEQKKKLPLDKQLRLERARYKVAIGYDSKNPKPPLELLIDHEKRRLEIAKLKNELMKKSHEELAEKLSKAIYFEQDANAYIEQSERELNYFRRLDMLNRSHRLNISQKKQIKPKKQIYNDLRARANSMILELPQPRNKKFFSKVFIDTLTNEGIKNIPTQKTISQWFDEEVVKILNKERHIKRRRFLNEKNISTSRDT